MRFDQALLEYIFPGLLALPAGPRARIVIAGQAGEEELVHLGLGRLLWPLSGHHARPARHLLHVCGHGRVAKG